MDTEAKQTMMGTEGEHTPLSAERGTANTEGDARLQPSALIVQRSEEEHTPLNAERRTANAEGDARLQPSALIVQRSEEVHTPQRIQLDGLTIDLERYCITRTDGSTVLLVEQEQLLLRTLIAADGRVVTKEQLGRLAWGWERGYSNSAIWNCVSSLRRKLGDDRLRPRYILTVRPIGYRLILPAPAGHSPQLVSTQDTPRSTP